MCIRDRSPGAPSRHPLSTVHLREDIFKVIDEDRGSRSGHGLCNEGVATLGVMSQTAISGEGVRERDVGMYQVKTGTGTHTLM
eukprot:3832742-Pyramimonas_sp.AAC.1